VRLHLGVRIKAPQNVLKMWLPLESLLSGFLLLVVSTPSSLGCDFENRDDCRWKSNRYGPYVGKVHPMIRQTLKG
jgi:hypothetical protein